MKSKRKSKSTKSLRVPNCATCGAELIRIVYGYPSGSMFRDAARGKIALGGCVVFANAPRWKCSADCDDKKTDEKIDS